MADENPSAQIFTNGFEVSLPERVDAIVRDFPNPKEVAPERDRLSPHWFTHWTGGKLYHLRQSSGGPNLDGQEVSLETRQHPWLLRARLEDAMAEVFPNYDPLKLRPFTFLAQKTELVAEAATEAGINPKELAGITVTPRYELNAKIYEPQNGEIRIGIFVNIRLAYDIDLHLPDLQTKGVALGGLHVIRRNPAPGQRRYLGRIGNIQGSNLTLSESYDSPDMKVGSVKLEGSKENFSLVLSAILRGAKRKFDLALGRVESRYRLGPDFDQQVELMGTFLRKKSVTLGDGIEAIVGERIAFSNTGETPSIYKAPPVDYVFGRSGAPVASYAWDGLAENGPYDRTSYAKRNPRLLVVLPKATKGKVEQFLAAFRNGLGTPNKGFPQGFLKVMGLASLEYDMCTVDLNGLATHAVASAYCDQIGKKLEGEAHYDAAIVVLQTEHSDLRGEASPYLQTKSMLMTLGIASQEIRMTTITQDPAFAGYSMRNLAISLYAKLGGIPWTVHHDPTVADELIIGMGFTELSDSRIETRQRHVGITTVFSGDGNYLLGNVSKECAYSDYPDALRSSVMDVLRDVKARNNWQSGDTVRLIFHAHRPLKGIDVDKIVFECAREVGADQDVELAFVTVTEDHPFYLIDRNAKGLQAKSGMKGVYAPDRGTIVRLGRNTRLLATSSGTLIKRELTPLPRPLLVSVHQGSSFTDVDYLSEQVLKFTSLSWRSYLPSAIPVTISYSERIAEMLGRLKAIPGWSTLALSTKLKFSRWFL
nr:Piwi domain-containing protein [uncultured Hyphomonas sp.]